MKIIDFYADWCGPCKMMDPIMKDFRDKYPDFEVEKVDIDKNMNMAQEFNISSVPTFVLLNDENEIVKTYEGAMPLSKLEEFIKV